MTGSLADRIAALAPEQRRRLAERLRQPPRVSAPDLSRPSPAQERLWYLNALDPGNPAYNIPFSIALRGHLDLDALFAALSAVVARHQALRTTFTDTPGGPRERVTPAAPVDCPVSDAASRAAVAELAAAHARQRFDLAAGPLLSLRLVRRSADDHRLLVCVHHIVFDGWSSEVFVRDLAACYGHFAAGTPLPSAACPGPAEAGDHVAAAADLAFWRDRLASAPPSSTVPYDTPQSGPVDYRSLRVPFSLPRPRTDELARTARAAGTTLNVVVLAALAAALHRAGAPGRILLGVPVAGRARTSLERVIGCFADTLIVDVDVAAATSLADLLHMTHRAMATAYAHQAAPFAAVVEAVAPVRERDRNPLYQVMVSFTDRARGPAAAAGVTFIPEDLDARASDVDLFLALEHVNGRVTGALAYRTGRYFRDTADTLLASLHEILGLLGRRPGTPARDFLARRKVRITASFTADPVCDPIAFWSAFLHRPATLEVAPYGQVVQQLLDPRPADAVIAYVRWADWLRRWPGDRPAEFLGEVLDTLVRAMEAFTTSCDTPLVLIVCPSPPGTWGPLLRRMDDCLARASMSLSGAEVVFATDPAFHMGAETIFDPAADEIGHIPFSEEFFAALGTLAYRRLTRAWGEDWPSGGERGTHVTRHLSTAASVAARSRPVRRGTAPGPVVAPATSTEARLARLWSEVLGTGEISVTADFFACGGHSLLAARLVSRIRAEFGRDLTLRAFLTHPTIAALAQMLDGSPAAGPGTIVPLARRHDLPLSATQLRIWAGEMVAGQAGDEDSALHTVRALRLTGPLDRRALRAAMSMVTDRHEVLRSTIRAERGRPVLEIGPAIDPWLPDIDLRCVTDAKRAAAMRDQAARDLAQRYDLARGPLVRAKLVREADQVHLVLLGAHRVVCDAESWEILLEELALCYRSASGKGDSGLEPLPVQFPDFAAWQEAWLRGAESGQRLGFWRAALAGAPAALELRSARPRPAAGAARAASVTSPLPDSLRAALLDLATRDGTDLFIITLTACAVALARAGAGRDLVLGTRSRGRAHPETDMLIGCFADLLPLRLDLGGSLTFRQALRRARQVVTDALAHQDVPFREILQARRPHRDPARHPLVQCVVTVPAPPAGPCWAGLAAELADTGLGNACLDMVLTVVTGPGPLTIVARYPEAIFDRQYVRALLRSVRKVLRDGVAAPDAELAGLDGPRSGPLIAVAATSSAPSLHEAVRRQADALGVRLAIQGAPQTGVLAPLLDPSSTLLSAGADLAVLVLSWPDLLSPGVPAAGRLADVTWEAERALASLVMALEQAREHARPPLLVITCPPGPEWAAADAIFGSLDDRLARCAGQSPGLVVARTGKTARDGGQPLPGTVSELIVRAALHAAGLGPRWIALDATGWPPAPLLRLVAAQARHGRQVVVGGLPGTCADSPLSQLPSVRIGNASIEGTLPSMISEGTLAETGGLVIAAGDRAASRLRRMLPRARVVTLSGSSDGWHDLLARCWPLDTPRWAPAREPAPAPQVSPLMPVTSRPGATAPSTDIAARLSAIWAAVLGLGKAGPHDDFFSLGGDSVLAVEAAFRAQEAGMAVTPGQILANPTPAALSQAVATPAGPAGGPAVPAVAPAAGRAVTELPGPAATTPARGGGATAAAGGSAPLGPSQRWFLDEVAPAMAHPEHFTHPCYLQLAYRIDPDGLTRALDQLAAAHDALRVRVFHDARGRWRQSCAPPGRAVPLDSLDLSRLPAGQRESAAADACSRTQRSLSLDGPLARALHLRLGDEGDRLLLVLHHLVTDGVSRDIMLEDLRSLLMGLRRGFPVTVRSSMPYLAWARHAHRYAQSARLRGQLPFWLSQRPPAVPLAPPDLPGQVSFGTRTPMTGHLTGAETSALLDWAARHRLKVDHVLVWAVAGALAQWAGTPDYALALNGRGRDGLAPGWDVSRTVGWLHCQYPVRLSLPRAKAVPESVASVAAQLTRVPGSGMGWSALRYCCADDTVRQQLAASAPLPRVSFDYRGHFSFDHVPPGMEDFTICIQPYGTEQHERDPAPFDLDISAWLDGARLAVQIGYGSTRNTKGTAARLLQSICTRARSAIQS